MNQNANTVNWAPHFRAIWVGMLSELLGWSEEEVIRWASKFDEFMSNPNDIFFHKPPQYWITNTIIPQSMVEKLSTSALIDLKHEIVEAFGGDAVYDMSPATDWKPCRRKIEDILAIYRTKLGEA